MSRRRWIMTTESIAEANQFAHASSSTLFQARRRAGSTEYFWRRLLPAGKNWMVFNDGISVEDPYDLQQPPASLLNSQRMYVKILKAMSIMESDESAARYVGEDGCASPYIKELDLFVTTTDIQGLRSPVKLADNVVEELRYRN